MKAKLILASLFLSMAGLSAQTYQVPVSEQDEPMMKGKFEPTWSSLENYQVPEWFRNVKFGIWAHWGPQCVEGSGDWMARSMYMEGTREYEYHVKHYGHPSEVGFKDIIPLWKAENWDPDRLVAFYNLKSATKLFSVLLASKRPLITELADKLRLKYPLLPTISPCPTMRLEAIRSIIPISCRRYPKSV